MMKAKDIERIRVNCAMANHKRSTVNPTVKCLPIKSNPAGQIKRPPSGTTPPAPPPVMIVLTMIVPVSRPSRFLWPKVSILTINEQNMMSEGHYSSSFPTRRIFREAGTGTRARYGHRRDQLVQLTSIFSLPIFGSFYYRRQVYYFTLHPSLINKS